RGRSAAASTSSRAQTMAVLERIPPVHPALGHGAAAALERDHRFLAVPALIVGSWATLLVVDATGVRAALHHHALIEGGTPLALAIPAFLAGWMVMVAAMMLPASLPTVHAMASVTSRVPRRRWARAAFLGSFAAVWLAFGLGAF